jgi:hypothetical protein
MYSFSKWDGEAKVIELWVSDVNIQDALKES